MHETWKHSGFKNYEFQMRTDENSNWVTVDSGVGRDQLCCDFQEFRFDNAVSSRFFRLKMSGTWGYDTVGHTTIQYMEFLYGTNFDDCVNNQCENGATCVDGDRSYSCFCPGGFEGDRCQNVAPDYTSCVGIPEDGIRKITLPNGVKRDLYCKRIQNTAQETIYFTLVGKVAEDDANSVEAMWRTWLIADHNADCLQSTSLDGTTGCLFDHYSCIDARQYAVHKSTKIMFSNEEVFYYVYWNLPSNMDDNNLWNLVDNKYDTIQAQAIDETVEVYDQFGRHDTCYQNQFGIMKLQGHGGSYPAATFNSAGNTRANDNCMAIGVDPDPNQAETGFTHNSAGYDAPTSNNIWPNDIIQCEDCKKTHVNVWLGAIEDQQTTYDCVCSNGSAVPVGDNRCDAIGAERCETCNPGYQIDSSLSCDEKKICGDEAIVPIDEDCFCAGHTNPCTAGQWCYDSTCKDTAKYPACTENAYYAQGDTCICGSETTACLPGKYCYNGVCSDTSTCQIRDGVEKTGWYGAHLDGHWNASHRIMDISLPVPSDITVTSITWNDAVDGEALRFSDSDVTSWTIDDTTSACEHVYKLSVSQNSFFGDGSHFILNGTHMKTTLRVVANEPIHQKVGTHMYTYNRKITNTVPLLVELKRKMTISATFRTTVPPTLEKKVKLDQDYSALVSQATTLLTECTSTYGEEGKVYCKSLKGDLNGKAEIVLDVTSTGTQVILQDVINDLCDDGFHTASFNFPTICEISHEEFVFLIEAEDNFEDSGMKTASLTMEVHSRTCVNHTLEDSGVRVLESSKRYIDESVADTTFTWKRDTNGEISQTIEENLCVEQVTWTFAPVGYQPGNYDIDLEFTLAGDNMGTFTTETEISLVSADVIATIGFEDSVTLYSAPECEDSQAATSFHIGEKFYAKISLSQMVVDAERITCDKMTLTQTRGSDSKEVNLKNDGFHFYQSATEDNSVVCGAELEAPLFANVDGYHTNIDFYILVDYKLGSGGDSGTTAAPARRLLRKRLSTTLLSAEDKVGTPEARNFREPEEDNLSIEMEILEAEEITVGIKSIITAEAHQLLRVALFVSGGIFAYVVYGLVYRNQKSNYPPLLDI